MVAGADLRVSPCQNLAGIHRWVEGLCSERRVSTRVIAHRPTIFPKTTTLACRSRDRRPGLCVMDSLSTVTMGRPMLAAGIPVPRGN